MSAAEDELAVLEAEHLGRAYPELPAGYRHPPGVVELPYLDADVAGLVMSYRADGRLDPAATARLEHGRWELEAVVDALTGEAAGYFGRLLRMADLVLGE